MSHTNKRYRSEEISPYDIQIIICVAMYICAVLCISPSPYDVTTQHNRWYWQTAVGDQATRKSVCFLFKKKYKNYKQPVPQKGGHTKQPVPQNFFEGAGNILCWQLWKQQAGHTYQCKSLKFFCQ